MMIILAFSIPLLLQYSLSAQDGQSIKPEAGQCSYDKDFLALSFDQFDQAQRGGWREIAERPTCGGAAANMIKRYRQRAQQNLSILFWHEGQLRALQGETSAAIRLFMQSRLPQAQDLAGWNPYVSATIAFLYHDRRALLRARYILQHYPKPDGWPSNSKWPQNLDVVNGLIRCIGRPYSVAYGSECRHD